MKRKFAAIALMMLTGSLAAEAVRASENSGTEGAQTGIAQQNRHLAERAQEESAAGAADAVRSAAKLDLDIALLGHKSVTVAGEFRDAM